MNVLDFTSSYVQEYMSKNDSSHDMKHVRRVYNMALYIAKKEDIQDEDTILIIKLASLLHDVDDHKYGGTEDKYTLMSFLDRIEKEYQIPRSILDRILYVIKNISYSTEKKRPANDDESYLTLELRVVQDADRLDALGEVGIARCLYFTATRGNSFEDAIQHFDDKLFHLKDMMKTKTGRKLAEKRTKPMHLFIDNLKEELSL